MEIDGYIWVIPLCEGNWHMCCSTYMNETVAWGVSGMKLQSWIPGVSFMLNCEAFLVGPSIHPSIHPHRCQTPTPTGQSLTLIRCRMASASRTAAMYFAWNVIFLCAGKARTAHWTCYGCNWGISKFIFEHPLTGEVVKMLNKIRISISIYNRQLFLEPGMGASEGEEFHSDLENPLAVSVNRVLF